MKSYITSIGTANPRNCLTQKDAASLLCRNLNLNQETERKLHAIFRAAGIDQRYTVIDNFEKTNADKNFLTNGSENKNFTVKDRMKIYEASAPELAVRAIQDCILPHQISEITHLITVSCTGMYAPGLDIQLVEEMGFSKSIQRLAINFMGCYAAFNSLKVADAICKSNPSAKVLIISLELCSLHVQQNGELDHLFASAIFGDGAAAVLVESKITSDIGLSLENFYCDLALEGKEDMAWQITENGFEMILSSYVPSIIKGGIKKLTENLFSILEKDHQEVDYYAIHPGGRKILEAIESALGISKEDNRYSYEVLRKYGNMSSSTVLFVLKAILEDIRRSGKEGNILSFAFGPGLTMESMFLKAVFNEELIKTKQEKKEAVELTAP